jgi:lipopolysaccharide biosynthesis protein
MMMANPDLDMPFCLHWANEAWTARWDGMHEKGDVLLGQEHSVEDDIAFIKDIEPALRDRRYIRVEGRPLLVIYRPGLFPDIKATIKRWNDYLNGVGLPSLYLCKMQNSFEEIADPRLVGFDGAIEYPPHYVASEEITDRFDFYDVPECTVHDYIEMAKKSVVRPSVDYDWYRGVTVGWDNTPRKRNGTVYVNDTPVEYGKWLRSHISVTRKNESVDKRLVFINAWNEHAEGSYQEPDLDRGYAILNETARALASFGEKDV